MTARPQSSLLIAALALAAAFVLVWPALAQPSKQPVPSDAGLTGPAGARPTTDAGVKSTPEPKSKPAGADAADKDEDKHLAPLPPASPAAIKQVQRGREIYLSKCKDCHGRKGDGNGAVARFMDPKPRDFRRGVYKLRSTEAGTLPTDRDIYRTISRGVPGTAMPGWRGLSAADRWRLVGYLKSLSPRFVDEDEPPRRPLRIPFPQAETEEAAWRGRKIFKEMKCKQCHGETGRGDGPAAKTLRDDQGRRIYPFNMLQSWKLKSGKSARNIIKVLYTGIGGTPMPSFRSSLTPKQAADLAYYIRSLFSDEW